MQYIQPIYGQYEHILVAHTSMTPASIFQLHGEQRPVRLNHKGGGQRLMKLDWQ